MIKKWNVNCHIVGGARRRAAYVFLPDSYKKNRKKHYPVLYMFDGHNVFFDADATYKKSWGMKEFLEQNHTELIVAAVECNHSPDHGRLKEYAPFDFEEADFGYIEGHGRETMEWFTAYFKPYIDRHYRTLPDRAHTFIAGSSMGGLMSIYALLHYNHIFSRAAALSPSLWLSPQKSAEMILSAQPSEDSILYMDYGSEEMGRHLRNLKAFGEITALLFEKGILLNCRIVPGGEHKEASWEKQIPFFMQTLLYGIDDSDLLP